MSLIYTSALKREAAEKHLNIQVDPLPSAGSLQGFMRTGENIQHRKTSFHSFSYLREMASVYKIIRRIWNSDDSLDSGCYDTRGGIQSFIHSGTGMFISKIGVQLEEEIVRVRLHKEQLSIGDHSPCSSSSSSSSDDDGDSGHDCADGVVIRKGVKITEVGCETFAHGFGLRDDDIIVSVNKRPVKSAAMVANMIQRIIKYSKNSQLRMEIHRRERGLIILDNGGDDLCDWDDNELICIDCTTSRMKSIRFRGRYLIVTSTGEVALSNFRTHKEDRMFKIRHYAKVFAGGIEEKFVTLQHKTTGKFLWIENGEITVKSPPAGDGRTLPIDSKYLIQVFYSKRSDSYEIFQPINETGKAIGFKKRRDPATLVSVKSRKALFQIFTIPSH